MIQGEWNYKQPRKTWPQINGELVVWGPYKWSYFTLLINWIFWAHFARNQLVPTAFILGLPSFLPCLEYATQKTVSSQHKHVQKCCLMILSATVDRRTGLQNFQLPDSLQGGSSNVLKKMLIYVVKGCCIP